MKKTRRTIDSTLKAKVALEAVRGEKSIAELAEQHGLHPNQIYAWKKQLENYAVYVFDWPIREITRLQRNSVMLIPIEPDRRRFSGRVPPGGVGAVGK